MANTRTVLTAELAKGLWFPVGVTVVSALMWPGLPAVASVILLKVTALFGLAAHSGIARRDVKDNVPAITSKFYLFTNWYIFAIAILLSFTLIPRNAMNDLQDALYLSRTHIWPWYDCLHCVIALYVLNILAFLYMFFFAGINYWTIKKSSADRSATTFVELFVYGQNLPCLISFVLFMVISLSIHFPQPGENVTDIAEILVSREMFVDGAIALLVFFSVITSISVDTYAKRNLFSESAT